MPIVFACPCGRKLRAGDGYAGRVIDCPACGISVEVPAPDAVDLGIRLDTDVAPRAPAGSASGSPSVGYEYRMVQLAPRVEIREGASHRGVAAEYLQTVVNRVAVDGWEFYRVDTLGITEKPGCLSSLLGVRSTTIDYYVATFRRPRTGS